MSFYFITGLPRSRTAWMANYLTHGRSMCFHDELLDGPLVLAAKMRKAAEHYAYVGHSDPANLFCWRELDKAFKGEARWVVLVRNVKECIQSVNRIVNADLSFHVHALLRRYYQLITGIPTSRFIHLSWHLNDEALDYIERFLFELPIVEEERRALLQKFNVQIESSQMQEGIAGAIQKGLSWVPSP